MAKRSRGRQRVEMVKIQNKSSLEVSFSKRRAGLFNKGWYYCFLTAEEEGFLVRQPQCGGGGGEVLSENNPAPVNESGSMALATEQFIDAHRNARVQELNMELTRLEAIFELEKKRGEAINGVVEANHEGHGWMRGSYDDLSFQQLVTLKTGMKNLLKEIHQKAHHHFTAVHGNGTPFNTYAGEVFTSGNIVSADPTSDFNFGTSDGAAGALPFTSGVPGAPPFTSCAAAAAATSAFPGSSSMASGYNAVSPWVACGNPGASGAFF